MRFTNTTGGPRGLNTAEGTVLIDPGQTSENVELSAAELKVAKGTGWWQISGEKAAKVDEKPAGPVAVHKGGGVYAVMNDANEVKGGLTKEEAAAFNALSDDEKASAVVEFGKAGAQT